MFSKENRAAVIGQLSQKSTVVALLSALALVLGWQAAPERLDAIATLLAVVNSIALAVVQEKK